MRIPSEAGKGGRRRKEDPPSIRDLLRTWDEENPGPAQAMLEDLPEEGALSNSFTRPQNVAMAQFEVSTPLFQGYELEEVRSSAAMLKPGDLVELRYEAFYTQIHRYMYLTRCSVPKGQDVLCSLSASVASMATSITTQIAASGSLG